MKNYQLFQNYDCLRCYAVQFGNICGVTSRATQTLVEKEPQKSCQNGGHDKSIISEQFLLCLIPARKLAEAVMLLTCIREVPISNLEVNNIFSQTLPSPHSLAYNGICQSVLPDFPELLISMNHFSGFLSGKCVTCQRIADKLIWRV
jgi:hypothetical protein